MIIDYIIVFRWPETYIKASRRSANKRKRFTAAIGEIVIYKSTCLENYIPMVMPPLNPTSPPSMATTFLATCLMAVLQPSGCSVFHGRDTPIQLSLP